MLVSFLSDIDNIYHSTFYALTLQWTTGDTINRLYLRYLELPRNIEECGSRSIFCLRQCELAYKCRYRSIRTYGLNNKVERGASKSKVERSMPVFDLDEVMHQAGEFGPFQRRIFFIFSVFQILAASHGLGFTFIARTPNWTCSRAQTETNEPASTVCQLFEEGKCSPEFVPGYTSIVTEVCCSMF